MNVWKRAGGRLAGSVNVVGCGPVLAGHVSSRAFVTATGAGGDVVYDRMGSAALVTLNRPKALNALTLDMVRSMTPHYLDVNSSPDVACVVLRGEGDKAFCAGGDVVSMFKSAERDRDQDGLCRDFFYEEYHLDYLIASMHTPHVALLDGIVMGGGVGVSVHGPIRVATERSVFAMPETAIGFFCDVGGAYFLPRLNGHLGMCLALAGTRLKGSELKSAGVATHYVPSDRIDALVTALSQLPTDAKSVAAVDQCVAQFEETPAVPFSEPTWAPAGTTPAIVDDCFGGDSVEQCFQRLEHHSGAGSEWATATLKLMKQMSPTALKVVFRQLREGSQLSLADCLRMEYLISQRFMVWGKSDFFTGVESALVAKKGDPKFRNPVWAPSTLADVSPDLVDEFFQPVSTEQKPCNVDSVWTGSSSSKL